MPDVRVLVVAEETLARAGLAALLASQPGLMVAGQITASSDVAAAVEVYRPDIVLWDLGWEPASALARLAEVNLEAPLAVLLPDIAQARATWAAGARALLLRESNASQLTAALVAAVQGLATLDLALARAILAVHDEVLPAPVEVLTPREIEVLRLLAEGLPNKGIARQLGISEHTVKFHVNAILGKLGVESRTEAVVRATRLGLILL